MQTITMYLRANSVKGILVDEWNQPVSTLPALTRGIRANLLLRFLNSNGERLKASELNYSSWDFVIANDWDTTTTPQIRVSEGIEVVDDELRIPLTETNTEELIAALGKNESQTFGCELAGFETGETTPGFLLQFDISIRNRRADAGTGIPSPVGDGAYSAAQIRALFAAKLEVELSDDGEVWYQVDALLPTPDTAKWYRFRNNMVGKEWSDPLPLICGPRGERSTITIGEVTAVANGQEPKIENVGTVHDAVLNFEIPQGSKGVAATIKVGSTELISSEEPPAVTNSGTDSEAILNFKIPHGPKGETGHESYLYVAYAERSDGSGFSLTPASNLKYRAEIQADSPIENLTFSNFADAKWVKYLGEDATTYGDVLVADADTAVDKVTRIVFENAKIRKGIDGEVIVNFKEAEVTNDEMNRYAVVNARTRLSSWTNGGGSPSSGLGKELITLGGLPELILFPKYSSFIGN